MGGFSMRNSDTAKRKEAHLLCCLNGMEAFGQVLHYLAATLHFLLLIMSTKYLAPCLAVEMNQRLEIMLISSQISLFDYMC